MKRKLLGIIAAIFLMVQYALPAVQICAAEAAAEADAEALTVEDILSVPMEAGEYLIDNLDLDRVVQGKINQSTITWSSSNPSVISTAGIVTRPDVTTNVTVTATFGEGEAASSKVFDFTVPAKNMSVNGMPTAGATVFEDTFSGETINSEIIKPNANNATQFTLKQKDGKLVFDNQGWDGKEPYVDFIVLTNKTNQGAVVYEYTLDMGEKGHHVRGTFIGTGWNNPLLYNWAGKEGALFTSDNKRSDTLHSGKLKVTAYFDYANHQYSLWLNNRLALENEPFENISDDIQKFRISALTAGNYFGVGTILIDNVKVYQAEKSSVMKDMENIINDFIDTYHSTVELDGKTYLTGDLSFAKTTGANGSAITYESSNAEVIGNDGRVTRDSVDRAASVTVTVTDENGSTLSKKMNYVIPGRYHTISNGLPKGARLADGTIEQREKDYNESFESGVNRVSFTSKVEWNHEPGFKYTYSSPVTGKFVQKLSFQSDSNALRFIFRGSWVNSAFPEVLSIYQLDATTIRIKAKGGTKDYSITKNQKVEIELLFDMTAKTVTAYVNGSELLEEAEIASKDLATIWGHHLYTSNVEGAQRNGTGTTKVYDLAAYRYAEPEKYAEIMKGAERYGSNQPQAGVNTVTVPLVKTSEGERECTILYAVYKGNETLAGVAVKPVTLQSSSHEEYTLSVNLDSVDGNETQKVFIWDGSLSPLVTEPFAE